jgi:hypothetical protein
VTMTLLIPIAVARAVVESEYYKSQGFNQNTPVIGRFAFAVRSTSRTSLYLNTVNDINQVRDLVEPVRQEQTQKPVIKKIEAFQADLAKLADRDEYTKQQAEKQKAEIRAIDRIDARRARERPMSMYVEVGQSVLADVAEDYGLNIKDPHIRAALIAAYRAGAQVFGGSMNYLRVQRNMAADYSPEDTAKWNERNRIIFERAAAKAGDDGKCGVIYGTGGNKTAKCGRPAGHPSISEDGIGHALEPRA